MSVRTARPPIEDVYPLSPMQQGLLFHTLLEPEAASYVVQVVCTFEGEIDVDAFQRAWQHAVDRHPALRTAFSTRKRERPLQVVLPSAPVCVSLHDLDGPEAVEELLREDRAAAFDLGRPPLMRLHLARLPGGTAELVWTFHHLVLDGWSKAVVLRDVVGAYADIAAGREPAAAPARPFADYIAWLGAREPAAAEDFWRGRVADLREPTPLPAAADRPLHGPPNGDLTLTLAEEASTALRAFTASRRLTLSTVVQGAWALLLSAYAGLADVVFGCVVSGRPPELAGVESMVGVLMNTLPVRVRVAGDATVADWLAGLQIEMARLRQFEHCSLVEVQRLSAVPPGVPMFHTSVAFENYPVERALGGAVAGVRLVAARSVERGSLPLGLIASPGERLGLRLVYDGRLLERAAVERLSGHLARLLEAVVEAPERRLRELDLVGQEERERLGRWGRGADPEVAEADVVRAVEEWARRTPDAVAVTGPDGSLDYRALDRLASGLALELRRRSLGPEAVVGVLLERGAGLVAALLGTLKAGVAYLALDPDLPAERLARLLADAGASVVVTTDALAERLAGLAGERLTAWGEASGPGLPVPPEQLAYVIYTSGSTGRPKGVMVTRGGLANYLAWAVSAYPDASPAAVQGSLAYDMMVTALYVPLLSGGRVDLLGEGFEELLASLAGGGRYGLLKLTPGQLDALARELPEAALRRAGTLVVGGEALRWGSLGRWLDAAPGVELVNEYGPTETVVGCCAHRASGGGGAGAVPIGRPIWRTRVAVLDREGRLAPAGVPGELCIGGAGVARGYVGRPDLTAERFVPDPRAPEPGARMYRSGDRARWLDGGCLEYLGRLDDQLKVRGYRVEPGEVEGALLTHPGVREAAVAGRERGGQVELVAYVAGPPELDVAELREHLSRTLPAHMVPQSWVCLEALPRAPSGKVDRRALPEPGPDPARRFVAPRTAVEAALASIWGEVLEVERVGVDDGFLELGGHSLSAIQVVTAVRRALGVDVPLRQVFGAATLGDLASVVESARAGGGGQDAIRAAERSGELPLSFAQQRLWFLDQLASGSPFYNLPTALRLVGALDGGALAAAIDAVVLRHEGLRTTFPAPGGRAIQVIAAAPALALAVVDLTGMPAAEREAEAHRLAAEDAVQPFELAAGPLLRTRLLRLGPEEHVLLLSMHHVVCDGLSMQLFLRDLAELYDARVAGRPPRLPELPIQYADYAVWQRAHGDRYDRELAYWSARLADLPPPLELPADHPRPAVTTYGGANVNFVLPRELAVAVAELSRREGATVFMTLLAAFQALLGRYAGQDDVVVGTPVAGRHHRETEDVVGFFVNTVVLRVDLSGDPTFRELLRRTREVSIEAFQHQEIPFEQLVDVLQPRRDLGRNPLFDIAFGVQTMDRPPLQLAGLTVSPFHDERHWARFDLQVSFIASELGLWGAIDYSTDLFEAATVERLVGHYRTILESAVAAPGRRLSELALLPDDEASELARWNATGVARPDACLPDLFAAQVRRSPGAVAVELDGRPLTFAELDRLTDRLAGDLRARGVGPESRVGIHMERSLELPVAIWGTLRAGAAYVPLDPGYPEERISYMRRDAGLDVVLTREDVSLSPGAVPPHPDPPPPGGRENVPGLHADNAACVIYTSGSTGRPKGIVLTHRGLCNLVEWTREQYGLGLDDALLQKTAISFDASVWEVLMPPLLGVRLVMARPAGQQDADYLAEVIGERAVTVLQIVPTMLPHLLEAGGIERCGCLRHLFVGGEPVPVELVERVLRTLPGCRVHNVYGPSECSVDTSSFECLAGRERPGVLAIGRPVTNARLHVLGRGLEPLPVGVAGELYVGGVGVGRGYLDRPDLTAERFMPDPFDDGGGGARLYRSGDLARRRADGVVEYLGRLDQQVKVRGFRIELGEVEAALAEHPDLLEAAAGVDATTAVARLVGYVVGRDGRRPAVADLRAHLSARLPEYMVPSEFVYLDALPRLPNHKLDRRALVGAAGERAAGAAGYVAPRSETEAILARAWAELLEVERVGVHDNFFELGGDSILSLQVIARVARDGLRITPRDFFARQTIAGLAEVAGAATAGPADEAPAPGPVPLTPIQLGFLEREVADRHHWNQAALFGALRPLDPGLLAAAADAVQRHHDALRLRFRSGAGGWEQVLVEDGGAPFVRVDLRGVPEAQAGEALAAALAGLQASLDLEDGPLLRVGLVELGGDLPQRVLVAVHHLVVDGVSWRPLLEDLVSAYRQLERGGPAVLPPRTTSFRAWAERLVERAASPEVLAELAHWTAQAPPAESGLPADHALGDNTTASASTVLTALEPEVTAALLQDVPAASRATVEEALLTALALAFRDVTGVPELLVDVEGHGREDLFEGVDLSRTVGWFTAVFPLRLGVEGDAVSALRAVKERRRSVPGAGLGHGLLRHLGPPEARAALRAAPPAVVLFNYLGQVDQGLPRDPLLVPSGEWEGPVTGPAALRSHPVEVNLRVRGGQLEAGWTYSRNLHTAATVERLAGVFMERLRTVVASCRDAGATAMTPSDFPEAALSQADLARLLGGGA